MTQRRTVVVVDDNNMLRRFAAGVLDEHDQLEVVQQLTSGQAIIAEVQQRCPDVIVLDHEMPNGTGLSVLPELRTACPTSRIVMWSASEDVANVALGLGADAAVSKDEPIAVLLSAVLDESGQSVGCTSEPTDP